MTRSGRMLVGAGDGRIGADRPILPLSLIGPGPQGIKDLLPRPIQRPAAMPVIDRLPVPVAGGQIPPRTPRTSPEINPVDHRAVIVPTVSLPRMRGQQRREQLPLFIRQIMTIQTFIEIHPDGLPNPKIKIYGTRPSCTAQAGWLRLCDDTV